MFYKRMLFFSLFWFFLFGCVPQPQQVQKPAQQADVHYKLGVSFLHAGNPTLALKELLKAVEYDPNRSGIHVSLAQAYQLKKAYPQAERHYLKALELSPNDPRYQNNLAALYLDMEQWDKAIYYFDEASQNLLFLNAHNALAGKGYAYFKKKDYAAALAQYQEVLTIAPRYAPAYFLQSEVYHEMGQTEQERKMLEQAIDVAPNYVQAIYQLGVLLLKEEDEPSATEKFEQVVDLAPDSEWGLKSVQMLRSLAH